eukprot:TRINITY_DN6198_c0_g3_i1.p1 TRINITY_DN6198_c0_g3~~TRINITY_DN6198_c0_g3_i1.p1  ORF type:complete len:523 (+),score=92.88 TRINITY_DN6198_c0_g3_i1:73-1569(+)
MSTIHPTSAFSFPLLTSSKALHRCSDSRLPQSTTSGATVHRDSALLSAASVSVALTASFFAVARRRRNRQRARYGALLLHGLLKTEFGEVAKDEDGEARFDMGGMQLTARAMHIGGWPPPPSARKSVGAVYAKVQTEGRGGFSEVPPFKDWPYYEIGLGEVEPLDEGAEELSAYKAFSGDVEKAFMLCCSWMNANMNRSSSFDSEGFSNLSSSKLVAPLIQHELEGLQTFMKWCEDSDRSGDSIKDFEDFISHCKADEDNANDLRSLVVGDSSGKLSPVQIEAFIGYTQGSALALWSMNPDTKTARVEVCLGHDCLAKGPEAEENLLRFICGKAKALGAERLICKSRFTEDAFLLPPLCSKKLGLKRCHKAGEKKYVEADDSLRQGQQAASGLTPQLSKEQPLVMLKPEQPEQDPEMNDLLVGLGYAKASTAREAVPGIRTWLMLIYLDQYLEVVNAWCDEMGAATLEEVIEGREDLADYLGDILSDEERRALLERDR